MFQTTDFPILGMEGEVEIQAQIGSKMVPEQPVRSHAEAFYSLKKCLGIQSSALHSFNITGQEFRRLKFILGLDTEKILSASFSGENTRQGSLINIKFDQKGGLPAHYAQQMYIVLHSDNVIEIGDSGVRVYD